MNIHKTRLNNLNAIAQYADQYQILSSAKEFQARLINEIRSAKERIYITALYLENDEAGREILTELYQAKQANPKLKIRVFVDWHRAQRGLIGKEKSQGNCAAYQEFQQQYDHGIRIAGVPVRNREVFGVLHLKGFIIDDTVIYSGASLNNIYLHQQDRYRFDRYHVIKNSALANSMVDYIRHHIHADPAVTDLTEANRPSTKSLKLKIKRFRAALAQSHYLFEPEEISEEQIAITPIVGLGKWRNKLNLNIRTLLASAEDEIVIFTPYFNFPKPIAKQVKKALKRGVNVKIIVGDKTANDFYISPDEPFKAIGAIPYLYEINLRKFAATYESYMASRQLSIHLWKHDANSFHLKGLWVDQKYILTTGHNFNPRAWKLDLENGLLVRDPSQQLKPQLDQELEKILQHAPLIGSYRQIETMETYPAPVTKLLRRVKRVKLDRLFKNLL